MENSLNMEMGKCLFFRGAGLKGHLGSELDNDYHKWYFKLSQQALLTQIYAALALVSCIGKSSVKKCSNSCLVNLTGSFGNQYIFL